MLRESGQELLTVAEVAAVLRCSRATVRRRISTSELKAIRTGSGPRTPLRVPAIELRTYIYGQEDAGHAAATDRDPALTAAGELDAPSRVHLEPASRYEVAGGVTEGR